MKLKFNPSKPSHFVIGYLVLTAVLTRFDPLNIVGSEKPGAWKVLDW
jgi:hypothetical protein